MEEGVKICECAGIYREQFWNQFFQKIPLCTTRNDILNISHQIEFYPIVTDNYFSLNFSGMFTWKT